ncbi:hypothetical protein CQ393_03980 [Stenotrophomonas sp. MYb238]|uniref:hypothetical protein n=1 Tax=Stenotrophomonas sp. MYb238 TaxID=2040281 RepID=UPI001290DF6A|nr:hypothetical protein [Stenotrophomonas sp. MYb238]MQP75054.1 hypothetical protein [Stenotrophomonas sp. MYb238]
MGLYREGFSRLKPLLPFAEQLPHGRIEPAACLANAALLRHNHSVLYMDQPDAVAALIRGFVLFL